MYRFDLDNLSYRDRVRSVTWLSSKTRTVVGNKNNVRFWNSRGIKRVEPVVVNNRDELLESALSFRGKTITSFLIYTVFLAKYFAGYDGYREDLKTLP